MAKVHQVLRRSIAAKTVFMGWGMTSSSRRRAVGDVPVTSCYLPAMPSPGGVSYVLLTSVGEGSVKGRRGSRSP